ncbi:hypothetical protein E2C01_076461 [Portunus trituberculatus]|uniref:Uncharacterized protein n=1 Tax=Portunus trituberculatus TaxID=210409 RepID=A0A5B7IIL2_PORTR|nr:hypothetical protein [Portunus trituberculatus]
MKIRQFAPLFLSLGAWCLVLLENCRLYSNTSLHFTCVCVDMFWMCVGMF